MSIKSLDYANGECWELWHGDSVEIAKQMPDASIDFCIHSPPFSSLYIYSDSEADMGNCESDEEFIEHYSHLIPELFRMTVSGRLCAVHCKDLPKYANRDGTAGLTDFPGMIIAAFESAGWSYHSRVTIWKCPVVERERTNNNGLLHKTVKRDQSQLRMGMADFLIVFRKPPVGTLMSDKPIAKEGFHQYVGQVDPREADFHPSTHARTSHAKGADGESIDIWRRYAEPVWWDIDQMDVLNYRHARSEEDERLICPLQLDLIERAVEIWSDAGDVVFSPFAGIGSEGVGAIRRGRKFVGVELKPEYFEVAKRELVKACESVASQQMPLFVGESEK